MWDLFRSASGLPDHLEVDTCKLKAVRDMQERSLQTNWLCLENLTLILTRASSKLSMTGRSELTTSPRTRSLRAAFSPACTHDVWGAKRCEWYGSTSSRTRSLPLHMPCMQHSAGASERVSHGMSGTVEKKGFHCMYSITVASVCRTARRLCRIQPHAPRPVTDAGTDASHVQTSTMHQAPPHLGP